MTEPQNISLDADERRQIVVAMGVLALQTMISITELEELVGPMETELDNAQEELTELMHRVDQSKLIAKLVIL